MKGLLTICILFVHLFVFGFKIEREVQQTQNGFMVVLNIQPEGYEGFTSIHEQIPIGAEVKILESANSTTKIKENKLYFIWLQNPKSNYQIRYQIHSDKNLSGSSIVGIHSFLQEGKRTDVPSPMTTLPTYQKEPTKTTPKKLTVQKKKALPSTYYSVQIAAAVGKDTRINFSSAIYELGEIRTDYHEGMTKYLMGRFNSLDEALAFRKEILNAGISGAWVVKYENGKRR